MDCWKCNFGKQHFFEKITVYNAFLKPVKKGKWSESGSVIQWYESADPEPYRNSTEPEPYRNDTEPEHRLNIGTVPF